MSSPSLVDVGWQRGIPLFLDQLIEMLRDEQVTARDAQNRKTSNARDAATTHGSELMRSGVTVDQVVRKYGNLCQVVTQLAVETDQPITVEEFRLFNACLDNAIAAAVTEFARQRDRTIAHNGKETMSERLGYLAHELRNLLNTAMLAHQAIELGHVALQGATGALLGRSLKGLRDLIDRSLAEVRLTEGLQVSREKIIVHDLIAETHVAAALAAHEKGVRLTVVSVEADITIDADSQMISAAIANLLQNAFKFTRPGSHVSLTTRQQADRVLIEVADECGGLPRGQTEELFHSFEQRSADRTGLGLGLSISRRSVEANAGKITVRNVPGHGCVFTIDLPKG